MVDWLIGGLMGLVSCFDLTELLIGWLGGRFDRVVDCWMCDGLFCLDGWLGF